MVYLAGTLQLLLKLIYIPLQCPHTFLLDIFFFFFEKQKETLDSKCEVTTNYFL